MALMVKNLPTKAGEVRHSGWIPGSGRSPRGGHGNPLQYSCLENPMDRGAWWAAVHGVAQSRTRLKQLSTQVQVGVGPLCFVTAESRDARAALQPFICCRGLDMIAICCSSQCACSRSRLVGSLAGEMICGPSRFISRLCSLPAG